MSVRVAAYYAPAPDDPLWGAACAWLGRDAETGAAVVQPDVAGIAELTEAPRLYGFHGTLKPPFRVATSYGAVVEGARAVAARVAPFELPALRVVEVSGFLALREMEACPALHGLADACVVGLDGHRAAADEGELARRRRGGLGAAQEAMLVRWGYPHVMETWFFHMTLTRRLSEGELARVMPLAEAHFAGVLGGRVVEDVALFTQREGGAPFLVAERVGLGG